MNNIHYERRVSPIDPTSLWGYKLKEMKQDTIMCKLNYMSGRRSLCDEIKLYDFQTLEPNTYLNDVIVNFYLKFLEKYVVN